MAYRIELLHRPSLSLLLASHASWVVLSSGSAAVLHLRTPKHEVPGVESLIETADSKTWSARAGEKTFPELVPGARAEEGSQPG